MGINARIKKLERYIGQGDQQVHVILWDDQKETEEQAMARFFSENPGITITPIDLTIFIRLMGGVEEERKGREWREAPTKVIQGAE